MELYLMFKLKSREIIALVLRYGFRYNLWRRFNFQSPCVIIV
jgi:hypothetical protein